MYKTLSLISILLLPTTLVAGEPDEMAAIRQAALDYIESQHNVSPERMERAIHRQLAKRTYWKRQDKEEFVMETDYDTMVEVAETYNQKGDRFPEKPRKEIEILDIDGRVASVKLTANDWIDYMHLFKNDQGEWKIINVLWQYHEKARHISKK